DRPARSAVQFFSTPVPSGVTSPTPVTTTRRRPLLCTSFPTKRRMVGRPPGGVKVTRPTGNRTAAPPRFSWPLALFAIAILVYTNTLFHQFVWDDTITLDQRIRFYRSPLDAFLEPPDIPGFPGVFRPLTFASFWLDQLVWWRNPLG